MSTAAAPALPGRWRTLIPHLVAIVPAGLGWAVLAALSLMPGTHHAMRMTITPGHIVLHAIAMAAVMLVPAALAPLAHVARSSFARTRARHTATFIGAFVLMWSVAAGAIATLAAAASHLPLFAFWLAVAVSLAAAALWHVSPGRARATMRCHCALPVYPSGAAGVASSARYGAVTGWACVRSCGAAMAVAMLLPFALPAMAVAMLLLAHEQAARKRVVRANARWLGLGAVAAVGLALLTWSQGTASPRTEDAFGRHGGYAAASASLDPVADHAESQ